MATNKQKGTRALSSEPSSNTRLASTKWEYRKVRVATGFAPAGDSAPQALRPALLGRRSTHLPLTLTVRYRGGPEASWLVTFRGCTRRFPGHYFLHDVLAALYDWHSLDD